jgi:hypothetical protein
MTISYRDGVSIGELAVYVPGLIIAIYLAVHHGFGRSAGWFFLIIFTLARVLGACLQLATISSPTNINLYIGYGILQNIGLSPLMLATLGLLSRLVDNINVTHHTFISHRIFKFIELVILVGLILGIVGGVNAGNDFVNTGTFVPGTLNKVGTALFIACYVAIVLSTILISFSIQHATHGEKRILLAVAISLPFLLVRLVYSIMSTLVRNNQFNLLDGSVTILLCVAFIEEFVVVVIYEGTGLTLQKLPKESEFNDAPLNYAPLVQDGNGAQYTTATPRSKPSSAGQKVLKAAKYTIIGRIITSCIPERNHDVEMQKQQGRR